MMRRAVLCVAVAACAWLVACSDGTGPEVSRPPANRVDLHADAGQYIDILYQSATAPKLESYKEDKKACYGESATLRVRYEQNDDDEDEARHFLRLYVPALGLSAYPDGTPFRPGDCVTISVSIDRDLLLAEFQPAGLRFNVAAPAELTLLYARADLDLDHDGSVDAADKQIEDQQLDVWRLPHDEAAWSKLNALHYTADKQLQADLVSFSHYAVAH